jgi:hypothetical protein
MNSHFLVLQYVLIYNYLLNFINKFISTDYNFWKIFKLFEIAHIIFSKFQWILFQNYKN